MLIALSVALAVLFDLAIFRFGSIARNVAVVAIGGALGIFFGFSIPLYSAVIILAFLAIYDVIAVYKGPVGKIAASGLDQLQGLSFSFKDIQMGLGDLVFYSMLMGVMFFSFPTKHPTNHNGDSRHPSRLHHNLLCVGEKRHISRLTVPYHAWLARVNTALLLDCLFQPTGLDWLSLLC